MKILEVETTLGIDKMSEDVSFDKNHLVSIVNNGQRGRIEEQRCSLGPKTSQQVPVYGPDPDEIYQLLVNSQSRRLDDQRVMLTSSPGMEAFTIKEQKETTTLKKSYDHICNMVSGTHSFRRRTPRKMPMTPASPNFSLSNPTERCDHLDSFNKLPSASFSPILDEDQMDYDFQGEQDRLFCLVSQAQRGSIDKQRCSINPLSHSSRPSDLHLQTDQEAEQFFTLIANTQNRRFDDQRATLNLLPEVLQSTGVTGQESDQLFNLVSRIQGSRIDDQRCSAPHIQLGSPAPPRRSHSRPASQTVPPSQSGPTRRSASFSPVSENQEQNSFDQDQFFSLVNHLQQSRMDDQRCSFEPSKYSSSTIKTPNITTIAKDAEQLFKSMVDKCALKSPPGLQIYSTENHKGGNKAFTPQITLTPASPAVPQKAPSRSTSPTLMLCDSPVRPPLTSYSPGSDEQRLLCDDMPMQITFQISMRFPPPEACGTNIHQCQLPEVFLTVGQPGETVVLPLNPKPGRPVSFSINPPKKHHYRSASPHRSPGRHERGRSSSPNRVNVTRPISPREDYYSLIQRVHTAQLQHNTGQDRGDMNREPRRGKGKSGGRKEKKEGNREKKK